MFLLNAYAKFILFLHLHSVFFYEDQRGNLHLNRSPCYGNKYNGSVEYLLSMALKRI